MTQRKIFFVLYKVEDGRREDFPLKGDGRTYGAEVTYFDDLTVVVM